MKPSFSRTTTEPHRGASILHAFLAPEGGGLELILVAQHLNSTPFSTEQHKKLHSWSISLSPSHPPQSGLSGLLEISKDAKEISKYSTPGCFSSSHNPPVAVRMRLTCPVRSTPRPSVVVAETRRGPGRARGRTIRRREGEDSPEFPGESVGAPEAASARVRTCREGYSRGSSGEFEFHGRDTTGARSTIVLTDSPDCCPRFLPCDERAATTPRSRRPSDA